MSFASWFQSIFDQHFLFIWSPKFNNVIWTIGCCTAINKIVNILKNCDFIDFLHVLEMKQCWEIIEVIRSTWIRSVNFTAFVVSPKLIKWLKGRFRHHIFKLLALLQSCILWFVAFWLICSLTQW